MVRSSSSSRARPAFQPPNDTTTYRDLLLFEERLKSNAAALARRKSRYQYFLAQLLAIITFLLAEVFLHTNLLSIPYAYLLQKVLPELYGLEGMQRPELHPYVAWGMLFVSITTLVLFFASGLYAEKIGYANRYVPHANKALRSFNIYLNVRKPPLSTRYPLLKPLSFLFPRTTPSTPSSAASPTRESRSRSPSPSGKRNPSRSPLSSPESDPTSPVTQTIPSPRRQSHSVPLSPIPPSTNPRGELIFSSRVDRSFREGYERYRNAFERARESKERDALRKHWRGWLWLALTGRLTSTAPQAPPSPAPTASTLPSPAASRAGTPVPANGRATPQPATGGRATPDLPISAVPPLLREENGGKSRNSRPLRRQSRDKGGSVGRKTSLAVRAD